MNITKKNKILIADDTVENLRLLVSIFKKNNYEILIAKNGQEALDVAMNGNPDLILLDVNMPLKNGFEVCEELQRTQSTKKIPIIFLTALSETEDEEKGLNLGAVDFIRKPFSPEIVQARVKNHLELKAHRDNLEELVKIKMKEKDEVQRMTIDALAILAEYRDNETGGHIQRTKKYVKALAEYLQNQDKFKSYLTDEIIEMLYNSAPLHDIGKVAIRDNVLLKPGKLTSDEMEEMKMHAYYGYKALEEAESHSSCESFLTIAKELAYSHHERYDGKGYPNGLVGEDIPLSGRLMAVADVYDALISKRVYKTPIAHSESVNIIISGKGTAFDPDVVDAFISLQEEFRQIALASTDFKSEMDALNS